MMKNLKSLKIWVLGTALCFLTLIAAFQNCSHDTSSGNPASPHNNSTAPVTLPGASPSVDQSAAPTITSISPSSAPGRGTRVTITGSNFVTGSAVTIGGISCTGVALIDAQNLTCVTGAGGVGAGDVVVTSANGQSASLSQAFIYHNFYYVSNQGAGTVSAFQQDPTTGLLTEIAGSPFASGASGTYGLAIDPMNRYLYAVNSASATAGVTAFSIDASTGALKKLSSYATAASPSCAVVTPNGKFLYVTNYGGGTSSPGTGISSFSIDPISGLLIPLGVIPSGRAPNRILTDAAGQFLYTDNLADNNVQLWSINSDGTAVSVGTYSTGANSYPDGMALDRSGHFLFVGNSGTSSNLVTFSVNTSTGVLSPLSSYQLGVSGGTSTQGGSGVDIDPGDKFVYATAFTSGFVYGFSLDTGTGNLTSVGAGSSAAVGANDVSEASTGTYTYVTNSTSNSVMGYSVDPSSGALKLVQTVTKNLSTPGMTVSTH